MKIEYNDNLPESRGIYERRIYAVIEMGLNRTLHLRESINNHGLDKIRQLPNGRVDLHTINEITRTIMSMVAIEDQMKTI